MKKLSIFMIAALALVACNKEQNAVVEQPAEADQTPVSFGAYVNRPNTKAGFMKSNITLDDLRQTDLVKGAGGFGVFAYYTNADNYDQTFTPNFMYNQQVKWFAAVNDTPAHFGYSPVKYWPNEFGTGAYSDDSDKISFFAYAPFVTVNPASGKVNGNGEAPLFACDNGHITEGIVGMKRNNAMGDPMVQYIVSAYPDQQVDLLWGVAAEVTTSGSGTNTTETEGDLTWNKKAGGSQTFTAGKPYLNVEHPTLTSSTWNAAQKVNFRFHHALASLNVTVDTKTNATTPASPSADTKVFVRSVTFEGFDIKGALNLNNSEANKALWYNFDCNNELNNGAEFTIYDGRKDGKEGLTAATKEYAAINPKLVQSTVWWNGTGTDPTPGVIGDAQNLFCNVGGTPPNAAAPILVIPNGDKLRVTIEYDVLTKDSNLSGMLNDGVTPGSVVKNVITRYITTEGAGSVAEPPIGPDPGPEAHAVILENGKQYTIALHLGLNSVEFDATVSGWASGGTGGADLPHNNN